jgi:hypothetical protein
MPKFDNAKGGTQWSVEVSLRQNNYVNHARNRIGGFTLLYHQDARLRHYFDLIGPADDRLHVYKRHPSEN